MPDTERLSGRAFRVAAVAQRLSPALWAALVRELGLRGARSVPTKLMSQGLVVTNTPREWTWVDGATRAALEASLSARDALLWTRAHHICARFFARRSNEGDLLSAVEHWLCIGERRRVHRLLENLLDHDFDALISPSIMRAIVRAVEGAAIVPSWLRYLHARVLERMGAFHDAIDAYERLVAETVKRPDERIPPPASLVAAAGQVALRVGRVRCAKRFLDAGKGLSTDGQDADLAILAARLSLARGDLARAQRLFRKAERIAEERGDRHQRAEARSGLGVVAMRAGNPQEAAVCYRRALPACVGHAFRAARVMANLAMALTITGGHEEAIGLFEEAIHLRDRLGDLTGVANSLAALASAREAAGDKDGASADLARARHLAAHADDRGLVVEIHLLEAQLAMRRGEHSLARVEWQKALSSCRTVEHIDPLLEAMLEETSAEMELSRRAFVQAHRHARIALRILRKNGAHYLTARLRLFLARCLFAANRPKAALRHLDAVARVAVSANYAFPTTVVDSRLLELGARSFDRFTGPFCQRLLGRTSSSRPSQLPLREATAVRIIDRNGARLAEEREIVALRQTPPALLLDRPKQQLVVRGRTISLGGRRLMLPLLLLFLERPTHAFEAAEIHRDVWGQDLFDDSAALRVRVALSRLRGMIGRNVLVTSRVTGATGATSTRYALCSWIDYAAIEQTLSEA